jgi:membrane-bound lytic murein transglycosylase D
LAEQQPSGPKRRWVWWVFACLAVLVCLSPIGSHAAQGQYADRLFPMPKSLKPNVDFWIHVFAKLEGGHGVLHDDEDLSIIYQTLYDLPRDKERRRSLVRRKRDYYKGILERLARGKRRGLTHDERRVLAMFEGRQTAAAFRKAAEQVRLQGGIREAFRAGLVRSGAYLPIIEPIFERAGLPKELALLPHVESSFRNDARSKSGAAGIWQFMPSTGRRFLRVNKRVDERHDVRLATIAATKLLKANYSLLGTWPLAITAYNHGAWGMKKAVAKTGTKDIGKIVRRYRGRTFGFASRNFYAEFLAAVHVVRNYERYFGSIRFAEPSIKPVRPQHYRVQRGDSLRRIAKRFNTTVSALAALNNLERLHLIQVGQILRIPVKHDRYRVRRGDTLGRIAKRFGTTVDTLVAMNGMDQAHFIKPGQVLRVAGGRTAASPVVHEPVQPQRPQRYRVRPGDSLSVIAARFNTTVATLAMVNGLSKSYLIKPGQVLDVAQPMPLRRYQVRRGDTLGRVAKRFRTTVAMLAALNGLRKPYLIRAGQTLVIPQLRSQHPDGSTVTGMRFPGEDLRVGLWVAAA